MAGNDFDSDFDSDFMDEYAINTIPRYIFIGTDGTVLNADAPKPPLPDLEEILKALPDKD